MTLSRLMSVAAGAVLGIGIGVVPAFGQEAPTKPPVVSHDLTGRDQCLMCHTAGVMEAVPDAPANHKDRTNEMCLLCHSKDSPMQSAEPKPVPHDMAGREQCLMCHKAGVMEAVPDVPANHGTIKQEFCGVCHKPAG